MNIFFKTSELSLEQKKTLCERAYEMNTNWWVDIKDVAVSWAREKIEMSFEDIMQKLTSSCHFVVIHRIPEWNEEPYGEIGFSTMNPHDPDYFLWIYISPKDLDKIIKEYNLKIL